MSGATPLLRRIEAEPFRLFFPLGALLGAVGVGTWLAYWLRLQLVWHGQAHALVQSQAFLMAFVAGFLMTMIPKRLGAPPATRAEIGLAAAGLIGVVVAAFADAWVASQACALLVLGVVATFGVRRFRAVPGRRMPDAFVLLPAGLLCGIAGGLLIAAGNMGAAAWTVAVGRGLAQEAQLLCLILGAGHLVLPILTGHAPPSDGDGSPASLRRRLLHVALALGIVASVFIERLGGGDLGFVRAGLLLRGGLFLADALGCMHAVRRPVVPGLHRRVAWLAFWLVPTGLVLAGLMPDKRVGLLHLTFVGGFALLSFAVGAHVIGAHGGYADIVSGRPRAVWVFGGLVLFAAVTRVSADFLPKTYVLHLGGAAAAWIAALATWAWFMVPKALARPAPPQRSVDLPVLPILPREGDHC